MLGSMKDNLSDAPDTAKESYQSKQSAEPLDIHDLLDIKVLEATATRVVMSLPVCKKVLQPYGILHGGVSVLLAESAASYGSALAAGPDRYVMGIEINASHLRSVRDGNLIATATPLRVGRTIQVWDVELTNDQGTRVCQVRCTTAVRETSPTH